MNIEQNAELHWLLLAVLMTSLMWVPYIINRMRELGVMAALWDRFGHTEADAAWANRMTRAHENAVENLVVFAPLVLLVVMTNSGNAVTLLAVQVYFFARLAHYIVFTLAIPLLRVVSFLAGFFAQMMLVVSLLN